MAKNRSELIAEALDKQISAIREFYNQCNLLGDKATNELKSFAEISENFDADASTVLENFKHSDPDFNITFKDEIEKLEKGFSQIDISKYPGNIKKAFNKAAKVFAENKHFDDEIAEATQMAIDSNDKYAKGQYDEKVLKEDIDKHGFFGVEPTIDECINLSFKNSDPDKLVSTILWLRSRDFIHALTDENHNKTEKGIFQNTQKRLENELEQLPITEQMKFMEKICIHDMAVKSKLIPIKKAIEEKAPNDETRKSYIASELAIRPECIAARSVNEFRVSTGFDKANYMFYIYKWSNVAATQLKTKTFVNEKENSELSDYISFDITKHQNDSDREKSDKILRDVFEKGNANPESFSSRFGAEYEKLMSDNRSANQSFTDMKKAMQEIAKIKHGKQNNKEEYLEKLNKALDVAKKYREEHAGNRITSKGKERAAFADNFAELLTERIREIEAPEKEQTFQKGIEKTEEYRTLANKEGNSKGKQHTLDAIVEARDAMTNLVGRQSVKPEAIRPLMAACVVCNSLLEGGIADNITLDKLNESIVAVATDPKFIKLTQNIDSDFINNFLEGTLENTVAEEYKLSVQNERAKDIEEDLIQNKEGIGKGYLTNNEPKIDVPKTQNPMLGK